MEPDIVLLALQLAARMKDEGAAMLPYSALHELCGMCEEEMLNRTMPQCAYAENMG